MKLEDFYENVFQAYKDYLTEKSSYGVEVVKFLNNSTPKFPLVSLELSNNIDTNRSTIDKIEYYEAFYFTSNIYTKNKVINGTTIASKVINDELSNLTVEFFSNLNMKKTLNKPTPNLDTSILRKTIQFQCYVGNARINIIRR